MWTLFLSDIHANPYALNAVCEDIKKKYSHTQYVLLGDYVNYGPLVNETLGIIKNLEKKETVLCRILGNHEKALWQKKDMACFSSERGKQALLLTKERITNENIEFLKASSPSPTEITINNKSCLLVHGNLKDPYWGHMLPNEMTDIRYCPYHFVLAGHMHRPCFTEIWHSEDDVKKNKELYKKFLERKKVFKRDHAKTSFIVCGAIGQSRNHNPTAQYVAIDFETETVHLNSVAYDMTKLLEHYNTSYPIHSFYKERLTKGI